MCFHAKRLLQLNFRELPIYFLYIFVVRKNKLKDSVQRFMVRCNGIDKETAIIALYGDFGFKELKIQSINEIHDASFSSLRAPKCKLPPNIDYDNSKLYSLVLLFRSGQAVETKHPYAVRLEFLQQDHLCIRNNPG